MKISSYFILKLSGEDKGYAVVIFGTF